ncbi:MAG: hypothetical protein JSR67_03705 [Proteobacteria bacterium]|nr:hypothetical protein [Pseudomonadota bacterium]
MAITLAQAQAGLSAWLTADLAVAQGQSYSIAGRSLTRANAQEITQKIQYYDRLCQRLSGSGGIRARYGAPNGEGQSGGSSPFPL